MIKALLVLATLAALAPAPAFDAGRLKTGRFTYDVRDADQVVASGVLQVARNRSGSYDFAGTFTASVCQHWESAAAQDFAPRSALLRFCKDGPDRPIFAIAYAPGRVQGTRYLAATPPQAVAATVPTHVVDQRIDWAAVMALDLKPGGEFAFDVYDPGTGISPLVGRVSGEEDAEVPAGRFRAYRLVYQMTKAGHDERYQSLVTVARPRLLLAITFPNGTTSRLISID